jgi:ABC-type nitrate/sulfonate/bicarbonate transport system substrate-binding protein
MHRQTRRMWTGTVVFLIALASSTFSAPAPGAERVRFALPGHSMGYLPLIVAIHRGFFNEEGIDLELIRLVPTVAHNALLLNEVQYHGLADSGLRLAARGAPIKAIFYGADRPMYYLVGNKEIRTVAELKGKKIGVSTFGGTSDLSARLLLKQHGIDEKNAILLQFGTESTRVGALKAGAADAIIVPVPAVAILKQEGYREIAFVGDAVEFASNGYSTTEKRIKENPQEVKKVVRSIYRGLRFAKENPEETIKIIEKEWKVKSDIARGSYLAIIKALNDDGIIGEKQLSIHFDLIRRTEKEIGEIPVDKVVDFHLLREVRRELGGK